MKLQYLTDSKGKRIAVILGIKDWEKIQKKLNTEQFYADFKESLQEIKSHKEGKAKPKDAKDLFK